MHLCLYNRWELQWYRFQFLVGCREKASCNKCNILYIGETSRQLNNRFAEHMRNVKHKIHLKEEHENDPDSNISKHFNLPNHSIEDMSILGLLFAPTDSTKRKTLEMRIIFRLATLHPAGLNKQINYLQ